MKKITFTADERLIEAAREQAAADNSTLNEQFRRWLEQYGSTRANGRPPGRWKASTACAPTCAPGGASSPGTR